MDKFSLELDGSLLQYALMCGFDLGEDGERAVRYGILAHMIDVLRRVPAGGPRNGAIPQMVCKADGAVSLPRGVL